MTMTKQQAHEESFNLREIGDTVSEFRERAMEIYAAAFAEWIEDNWTYICLTQEKERQYSSKFHEPTQGFCTIHDLITKFEKQ